MGDTMNKILAALIFGMGIAGAILLISIPALFSTPIKQTSIMISASSTVVFIILARFSLVLKRHQNKK